MEQPPFSCKHSGRVGASRLAEFYNAYNFSDKAHIFSDKAHIFSDKAPDFLDDARHILDP
jgi:hypothetical protein